MWLINWRSALAMVSMLSFPAQANLEPDHSNTHTNEKLASYSNLIATAVYHWNFESDVSNKMILSLLTNSGLQQDPTSEAIVFRHLLATTTAQGIGDAKSPIFVKSPLLKEHWQHLKELSLPLYAAAKAYYIFNKNANKFDRSSMRIRYSIPELANLKNEMLSTESPEATAIASIWLGMELSLLNPIQAISEIEYALPYLPERNSHKTLEGYFSKVMAHDWLRTAYLEISVPSRAYYHSLEMLNSPDDTAKAWAYFFAIDALILQNQNVKALDLSNTAIKFIEGKGTQHEKFLLLVQRLRVLVFSDRTKHRHEIDELLIQIDSINTQDFMVKAELLITYYAALKHAIPERKSERDFLLSVRNYELALRKAQETSGFEPQIALVGELELSRLYEMFGKYDLAYHHLKHYNAILVEKNKEQFKVTDASMANTIRKDIELLKFRKEELNTLGTERLGLSEDNALKTNTIYILILLVAALLLMMWNIIHRYKVEQGNIAKQL